MFRQLINLFRKPAVAGPAEEPYQPEITAALEWQPLDVARLNLTSQRLRQIEASLAEKARAEFAAVTREINASQHRSEQN